MEDLLAQPTRHRIHDVVCRHPGASAREIQRSAELAWGETAYHLDRLTRGGLLRRERGGRRDYYFPSAMRSEDRRLFQALRSPAQRHLIMALSRTPGLTIAEMRKTVGFSLSTTSFHLRRLLGGGVIERYQEGNLRRYRVHNAVRAGQLLKGYKDTFEDDLVDRFVDAWSGFVGG